MAVLFSFIQLTIKALFLLAVAYAGIICGKKFKDSRKSADKVKEK